MNYMDKAMTARGLDAVVRLDIGEQAVKVICRLAQLYTIDKDRYYTFAEVHRNFKAITSEDVRLLLAEFERCGMIVTKVAKNKVMFKFNEDITKFTNNVKFDTEEIIKLRKAYEEKLRKKIERAKKFLKEVEARPVREKNCLDDYVATQYAQTSPEITLQKTAKELHDSKECDPLFCRFCALEQNKELGF